jgi:hypothetical protein
VYSEPHEAIDYGLRKPQTRKGPAESAGPAGPAGPGSGDGENNEDCEDRAKTVSQVNGTSHQFGGLGLWSPPGFVHGFEVSMETMNENGHQLNRIGEYTTPCFGNLSLPTELIFAKDCRARLSATNAQFARDCSLKLTAFLHRQQMG